MDEPIIKVGTDICVNDYWELSILRRRCWVDNPSTRYRTGEKKWRATHCIARLNAQVRQWSGCSSAQTQSFND